MRKLSARQSQILEIVQAFPKSNTSLINKLDGNRRVFESNTKERLLALQNRGLIKQEVVLGPSGKVKMRLWKVVDSK